MSPDIFEALAPAFPHLDALVLNGIGESLLHPQLETFIRKARMHLPQHAWIGFQSNGMAINDHRAASLIEAGLDRICLSLDTLSDEQFRYIRNGGNMGSIVEAFAVLRKTRQLNPGHRLRIGIEFVLMRNNLNELPETIRWAARSGASFAMVTQLLPYHKDFVAQAAYDTNTAGAISIYERWKKEALRQHVDIGNYFDIFMKYAKTPMDQQVIRYVEQMRNEAHAEGITLHLEKLLHRDEEWFAHAGGIFEEARRVAASEGIELSLPEMAPRNTRRCEFVEGDGAFVAWNGDVHPCYFLWHHYACYVGGIKKQVRPWVLGNLRERDITDIWNDEGSRSFRERVREYRFPFCFDCSFALCDYVGESDFEHDCYHELVPCGACLWCTGLFQCLQ